MSTNVTGHRVREAARGRIQRLEFVRNPALSRSAVRCGKVKLDNPARPCSNDMVAGP